MDEEDEEQSCEFPTLGTMRLYMKMTMKAKAAVYLAWRSGTCCTVALLQCSKFILHCMKGRGATMAFLTELGEVLHEEHFRALLQCP